MPAKQVEGIEAKLTDVFVKNAPALPEGGKKFIVKVAPIASLIIGVLTLISVWSLWHWAHVASTYANYARDLCDAYQVAGCDVATTSRLTFWVWLSMIFLIVEGILYLCAYAGLRDRKKQGWNYLFYGALVNIVYAVITLFTDYDKVGHFLGALIGSAIGFYLLFQVRSYYLGKVAPAGHTPVNPVAPSHHEAHHQHTDEDK
jgi:hypothetical protein